MPTTYGTIQTMARAYTQICEGIDPWIALGNFRNAWYGYAKDIRPSLVAEPLPPPHQKTIHLLQWQAFCAASVEFLCVQYAILCPEWVENPHYILPAPWWHLKRLDTPAFRAHLAEITPEPFARRNIFCGNRLFQNKYEMSAWIEEARSRGIADPIERLQYAREKERAIHGG